MVRAAHHASSGLAARFRSGPPRVPEEFVRTISTVGHWTSGLGPHGMEVVREVHRGTQGLGT